MAAQSGTDVLTPVGRIVWGHPATGRPKLDNEKKPVLKDGKQVIQWSFGLAIPRADFERSIWPLMAAEAMKLYPNGQFPPKFAWKYKDGDTGVDDNGKPLREREGYAGNIVLAISTEFQAPKVFKANGAGYDELPGDAIKTGDFVQVNINIDNHPANPRAAGSQAGLYINPRGVLFIAYGQAIVTGPDAATMFAGATPTALPPGASLTPPAPLNPVGMPMQAPPPAAQPGMPGNQPPVTQAPPVYIPQNPMPPVATAPAVVPPMVPPAVQTPMQPGGFPIPTVSPSSAPPMQPSPPAPAPVQPAQSFVTGDPNAPVFQGYNPQTGKQIWKLPATGQVWEQ